MEDDRRVWPPGSQDPEAPWNPRLRRTVERSAPEPFTEPLPPSARLYGAPTAPRRAGGGWRARAGAVLALVVAGGMVAGLVVVVLRLAVPERAQAARLSDAAAGVTIPLPEGWREDPVPPVTGFTSAARSAGGALVMARPSEPAGSAPGAAARATAEAAELYSRLLLHGDKVTVVEDRSIAIGPYSGHTRSLRAEYKDVVNQPAYLRVMLLTKPGRSVVVVGLLQPDQTPSRQALEAVMTSVR
ncbi:hypothetical protein ACFSKW_34045 [Nonomuraea mangrovi]|uniref:DUF1795 domain-containing protein n=1 Tax=Nonomuraea mangrovi TaxID=2316207 RepID=A0ABW4T4Z7_9ACTN